MIKQPYYTYDKTAKILTVQYDDTHDYTAIDIIYEYVKDIKQAHICLSGGVDSQFWVRVCEHFNIPYTTSTYLTTWEGSPINTDDYVCAQLTAQKFNCDWTTIDIDMKEFYSSNRPIELAKKYITDSQQICLHLEYLEKVKLLWPTSTILMGGDAFYIEDFSEDGGDLHGLTPARLQDILTYENFFKQNDLQYLKDIFYLDAKMPSHILQLNIDYVRKHKKHLAKIKNDINYHMERLPVKSFILESILPGTVPTLIKVGGFERIKKYFAMTTGIYNYFDKKYRTPLVNAMADNKEIIHKNNLQEVKVIVKNKDDVSHYIHTWNDTVKEVDSEPLITYLFDF